MVFGSFFGARTTCDTVSVFRFSIDRFKGVFVDYCILFILRVFCKKSQIKNYYFLFFLLFFFFETIFFQPGHVTCSRCCTFPVTHVVCMALRAYKPSPPPLPHLHGRATQLPLARGHTWFRWFIGGARCTCYYKFMRFFAKFTPASGTRFFPGPVTLHVRVG